MDRRRIRAIAAAIVLGGLAWGGWWLSTHLFRIRAVVDDEIYRSAQPDATRVRAAANEFGIKTIINLRGSKGDFQNEEKSVTEELGIELVSLPFEAFAWPPRIETVALLDALDTAERPILIHCQSGIDRSGWAAGVVELLRGAPLDEARSQLSRIRGHFCNVKKCGLHNFFFDYQHYLDQSGLTSTGDIFRSWVLEDYYPGVYRARIAPENEPVAIAESGGRMSIDVTVANESRFEWLADFDRDQGVRLGVRLLGPYGKVPEDIVPRFREAFAPARDVYRQSWDGTWAPGESRTITVDFEVPSEPGTWVAQIDMVDEFKHWFCDLGDPGLLVTFEVE